MSEDKLRTGAINAIKLHRTGSFKTRHNHIKECERFIETLRALEFGVTQWENVTNRHIAAVVKKWQEEGLAVATIKEYLAGVRYVCKLYNNLGITKNNAAFGIGNREYIDNIDRSLAQEVFDRAVAGMKATTNEDYHRVAAMLLLERSMGLRSEESAKFEPKNASTPEGYIYVRYGTKGGRDRQIQTVTESMKSAIEYASKVMGNYRNLIPKTKDMTEAIWMRKYYRILTKFKICKKENRASGHGCRHAYAQERYAGMTGFQPPCKFQTVAEAKEAALKIAGEKFSTLDQHARDILKGELGHGPDRGDVVSQYVGSWFQKPKKDTPPPNMPR